MWVGQARNSWFLKEETEIKPDQGYWPKSHSPQVGTKTRAQDSASHPILAHSPMLPSITPGDRCFCTALPWLPCTTNRNKPLNKPTRILEQNYLISEMHNLHLFTWNSILMKNCLNRSAESNSLYVFSINELNLLRNSREKKTGKWCLEWLFGIEKVQNCTSLNISPYTYGQVLSIIIKLRKEETIL